MRTLLLAVAATAAITTAGPASAGDNFDGPFGGRDIVSYSRDRGDQWHRNYELGRYRARLDLIDGYRGTEGSVGLSGQFRSSSFTCSSMTAC